jgi:hypothetical protein
MYFVEIWCIMTAEAGSAWSVVYVVLVEKAPAAARLALAPCAFWPAAPKSALNSLACGRPRGIPLQSAPAPPLTGQGTAVARLPPTPGRPEHTGWVSIACSAGCHSG